jgi:hypothetical protein
MSVQDLAANPACSTRSTGWPEFDRFVFMSVGLLAMTVMVVGFGRSFFYAPFMPTRDLRPILQWHAAVFTAWVLLFVAQTTLIWTHRPQVHRRLGVFGAVLAASMVVVGSATVIDSARRQTLNAGAINLFGSLALLALFAVLVVAALRHRKEPALHKRLMAVATLALASAGLGRILPQFHLSVYGETLVSALYYFGWMGADLVVRRRVWRGAVVGALVGVLIAPVGIPLVALSEWWRDFAGWLLH